MIGRLIKSAGVLYAYFPHMILLRLMGPRCALLLARASGWVHSLPPFARAQARVRYAMEQALRGSQPDLSLRTTLRKYLALKHQRFVEWYVYPTLRGRRFVRQTYRRIEGREYLDAALAEGKGVIILVFHFGLAKMVWPALKALGYDNYHHVFRGATYAGQTFDWVAKAAMDTLAKSEKASGLKMIYHRPFYTFEGMVRLLRRNAVVGMNGDGMMGTDFVELPFLDGTMTFPTGPARLAACTGAPILPTFCLPNGFAGHHLRVHAPIRCTEDTPEAVEATLRSYVELLETYTRRYPWAWWTWRRLYVTRTREGKSSFTARALSTEEGTFHAPWSGAEQASIGRNVEE